MGVVLWGFVNEEVEQRLAQGVSKLRPQDWKSGDKLWAIESLPRTASCSDAKRSGVIAPFGGHEEMIKDLKTNVFPDREIRYVAVSKEGKKDVKVV